MVLGTWSAHAETEVDLALVLAVDVSLSMEADEQELQRHGFVEAFRSPAVHEAIRTGMLKRPDGAWDIDNLDRCFRDCVIGGPGAFMIPVREKAHFAEAIRTKIVREIAETPQIPLLVQPAQSEAPTNCLTGELRRQQRMGN